MSGGPNSNHRFDVWRSGRMYRAVCSCGWKGEGLWPRAGDASPEFYAHLAAR